MKAAPGYRVTDWLPNKDWGKARIDLVGKLLPEKGKNNRILIYT